MPSSSSPLGPADRVVQHLLDRILKDHNVLYYCGPNSTTFDLLCEAQAARLGCTPDAVRRHILRELGTQDPDPPDALRLQRRNDQLEELLDAAGLRAGARD